MKKQLVFALLIVLLLTPVSRAQDLEDTIEDELGRSSADSAPAEDNMDDELGEIADEELGEQKETPPAAKSAPAPAPKPKAAEAKPTPAPASDEDEMDAELAGESSDDEAAEEEEEVAEAPAETPAEEDGDDIAEVEDEIEAEAPPADTKAPAPKSKKAAKTIYAETLSDFDDQVNPAYEARLYEIFSKRKQVDDEQWSSLVGRNSSGIYKVQRGDTLWDISQTFFGDGNFWPRLWSENSVLTNPHEISVGKAIAFVAGTEESAPVISVTDAKAAKVGEILDTSVDPSAPIYPEDPESQLTEDDIAAGTVLEEQPIVGGRPEIPEPLTPRKAVLKNLPPSFIEPVPPKMAKDFDSTGLDVGRRKAFEAVGALYIPAYLSDGKPSSVGRVTEIVAREKTAAFLQDVIVKLDRPASVGEKFTSINIRGNVTNEKTRTYGPVIEIGGMVEIKEPIDEGKNVYRAKVVISVGAIEAGGLLTDMPLPRVEFSKKGQRVDLEAIIIGGQFSKERRLLGQGNVVYIDRGSQNGLSEGQLLAVRSDRELRRPDTDHAEYKKTIGIIKLVRVLERVSTAVVIDASEEIRPGDFTGGPFPKIDSMVSTRLRANNKAIEIKDREEEEYKEEFDNELSDEMDEEF